MAPSNRQPLSIPATAPAGATTRPRVERPRRLARRRRPRPLLRTRAWWSRDVLTRTLAEGAAHAAGGPLGERARQLARPRGRGEAADALVAALGDAANPQRSL